MLIEWGMPETIRCLSLLPPSLHSLITEKTRDIPWLSVTEGRSEYSPLPDAILTHDPADLEQRERNGGTYRVFFVDPDAAPEAWEFLIGGYDLPLSSKGSREHLLFCLKSCLTMNIGNCEEIPLREALHRKVRESADLQSALNDRENLLKEIHHRVKNNFAMVSSLIHLQERFLKEEPARSALRELDNHIRSLSLIHEKLYKDSNLTRIGTRSYLTDLAQSVRESFRHITPAAVRVETDIDDVLFPIDHIIPLGLIATEMLTDCFKYAFPPLFMEAEKRTPRILLSLELGERECRLSVEDNGVGFDPYKLKNKQGSLGLTLIESLAQQMSGQFYLETPHTGTRFIVKFPPCPL